MYIAVLGRNVCCLGDRACGGRNFRGYMSVRGTGRGIHHGDLGEGCGGGGVGHVRAICVGESWAHSACLGFSGDYLILVARNPGSMHRSWWERDWDAGWVSKIVATASKLHLSLVLTTTLQLIPTL